MAFRFSQRSVSRATGVDPLLFAIATLALYRSAVDFGLTEEQSRSEAEQREKVARGVSKTMNSKHMIPAGKAFSTALDLVPFIDGRFQWGDNQWRVQTADGRTLEPFYEIAAAMREAAIAFGVKVRWGGVWDRTLDQLPAGAAGMKRAVEEYKARHPGPDFLDGPHFELA
jgi:peptidoglycan L-alanyl-D-glutamate endopeptidase CwlK